MYFLSLYHFNRMKWKIFFFTDPKLFFFFFQNIWLAKLIHSISSNTIPNVGIHCLNTLYFAYPSDYHPVYSDQWAFGSKCTERRLLWAEAQTPQIWGAPLASPRPDCRRGWDTLREPSCWGRVEVRYNDAGQHSHPHHQINWLLF